MTDTEIITLLEKALDEVAPGWKTETKELRQETKFRDMNVDSINIMEMVGIIEEECDTQFADEDLAQINKVGDLVALIKSND